MPDPSKNRQNAGAVDEWRIEAWRTLNRIESDRAFVSRATESTTLEGPDRGRLTDLVSGVTRQRRWLDFLINSFVRQEQTRLEPGVRQALRMGIHDLLFSDRPSYAAVDQTVELVKRQIRPQAARLVNGVLRNVTRSNKRLPTPRDPDPVVNLAIQYSHPDWMVRRWLERFGEDDVKKLLQINNRRPHHTVRFNALAAPIQDTRHKLAQLDVNLGDPVFLDDCVRVLRLESVLADDLFRTGQVSVQDEAAMCVIRWLDPKPGERLLDLCAAPGGKSIYSAERMENQGAILAVDRHAGKLRLLRKAAKKHGVTIVETRTADAREIDDEQGFDAVLLDAPCSGTGVLGKRADLRWNRKEKDLTDLCKLQADLLASAAKLVRPGGRLVYATCSIEVEENQKQVKEFLAGHANFKTETPVGLLPDELATSEGWLELLPQHVAIDGAFAARLVRR